MNFYDYSSKRSLYIARFSAHPVQINKNKMSICFSKKTPKYFVYLENNIKMPK